MRLPPGRARLLVGRNQAGCAGPQFADPALRIRVGRQPLRRAAAACGDHVLPQVDRFARIETGLRHQLLADHVGFGFLRARARQQEAGLRQDAAALHRRVGGAAAAERRRR